ncbi:DUF222 domain-containing protein [Georgenia sp. MJ173]|uniref:HNH endonuclease n=1 Tax=Georgenia sunbinii TaxID=3117728 RepID=UPI002F2691E4
MTVIEDRRADTLVTAQDEAEMAWLEAMGDLEELFAGPCPTPEELAELRELEMAALGPQRVDLVSVAASLQQTLAGVALDPTGVVTGLTEAEHLDVVRALEDVKAATAAAQAVLVTSFERVRRDREKDEGVRAARRGKGVSAEIALARRLSPHRAGRELALARKIVAGMPRTLAAMRTGALSERRAGLLAAETEAMDATERTTLDEQVCTDPARFATWGDKRLTAEARRAAYELSPDAAAERTTKAAKDRRVTLRPAAHGMAYLSALLPAAQALTCHSTLTRAADSAIATGDPRGRGQLMADTLIGYVTGQFDSPAVPVQVQLVMTDHALLNDSNDPAVLPGYGTVPAPWARDLIARALATDRPTGVWLRQLFTHPTTGQLVAMTSRARTAPAGLATFITLRDGATCRTAWCDAPVRHIDHVVPHARGGPTTAPNLQGLCERCNYIKELPGWQARLDGALGRLPGTAPPTPHPIGATGAIGTGSSGTWPAVITTTPTATSYTTRPPPTTGQ